mmetsp:Transcript_1778/g.3161  ORF Transcript_1778/g.3161 Transcript_1778/m.3161 type:complete len:167 (-) Transcript_1778:1024-1524(-)
MMFQEPSAAFRTPTSSFVSSSDPTSPPPAPKPKRYRVSKVGRRHVDAALSVCPELMMPLLNETVLLSRVPSFRLKRRSSAQAVAAAGGRRSQQVSPEPSPSRLQSVSNDQQYCPGQQQQQQQQTTACLYCYKRFSGNGRRDSRHVGYCFFQKVRYGRSRDIGQLGK